jgi:hypothetical protein
MPNNLDGVYVLKPKERRILELMVFDGLTKKEASSTMKYTYWRLAALCKTDAWKQAEWELRREHLATYQGKMQSLIPKALHTLEEAVVAIREERVKGEDGVEEVKYIKNEMKDRLMAAKEILSRGGIVAGVRVEGDGFKDMVLSPEVSRLLDSWGAKLERASGDVVVDIEPVGRKELRDGKMDEVFASEEEQGTEGEEEFSSAGNGG